MRQRATLAAAQRGRAPPPPRRRRRRHRRRHRRRRRRRHRTLPATPMPQTPTTRHHVELHRRPLCRPPAHSLAESALGVSDAFQTEARSRNSWRRNPIKALVFLLTAKAAPRRAPTSANSRRRTPPSSQNVSHSGVRLQQLAAQPAPRRAGSPSACQENGYHHRRRCLQGRCCAGRGHARHGGGHCCRQELREDPLHRRQHLVLWRRHVRRQESRSPTEGGACRHS